MPTGDAILPPFANHRTRHDREAFCDLCQQDGPHEHLYDKLGYPILRCRRCRLVKTELPPVGVAFDRLYDATYFEGGQADGYADYGNSRAVIARQARRILRCIEPHRRGNRLLEIGCAYGFFLEEAARTYDVVGIDFSAHAAAQARARGLRAIAGTIESADLPDESFDAVAILETIEHLPSPFTTLTHAHRVSKPGAVLVVSTGDIDSLLGRVCGRSWRLLTPPQHLFFFSRQTLAALARRTGFRPVRIDYAWRDISVGLAAYQFFARTLGVRRLPIPPSLSLPMNLYDVMTMTAIRV